ncbi:MAG TPA: cyclic nucleotide-binding domain-containing protein [Actinomycetota bacterium]
MARTTAMEREAADLLGRTSLFSELSKRELLAIARAGKEVRRPEGATLAQEGEAGVGFFLILEGDAAVSIAGRPAGVLIKGDTFGEVALLDGGPRTASVEATSPVRLFGLTQWAFTRVVREYPTVALKLLQVLAGYVRNSASGLPQL